MALKLLKFIIALALAPFVAGEIWTVIDLARAAAASGPFAEKWFISLGAGMATWLLIYFLLPRTTWIYVLGHELTHALTAMMAGGKISSFQVGPKGGHVITDKVNWWITLSPYFVPLYALIWMALWISADFYHPLKPYQPILYFGIGVLWCFHLTFTASMVRLGQTDLSSQGIIFSLVIILLTNLVFFLFLFAMLAHNLTWTDSGELFLHRVGDAYIFTWHGLRHAATWAWSFWK
jgi:hypothetical protein